MVVTAAVAAVLMSLVYMGLFIDRSLGLFCHATGLFSNTYCIPFVYEIGGFFWHLLGDRPLLKSIGFLLQYIRSLLTSDMLCIPQRLIPFLFKPKTSTPLPTYKLPPRPPHTPTVTPPQVPQTEPATPPDDTLHGPGIKWL